MLTLHRGLLSNDVAVVTSSAHIKTARLIEEQSCIALLLLAPVRLVVISLRS